MLVAHRRIDSAVQILQHGKLMGTFIRHHWQHHQGKQNVQLLCSSVGCKGGWGLTVPAEAAADAAAPAYGITWIALVHKVASGRSLAKHLDQIVFPMSQSVRDEACLFPYNRIYQGIQRYSTVIQSDSVLQAQHPYNAQSGALFIAGAAHGSIGLARQSSWP